jgi:hypothetical protein
MDAYADGCMMRSILVTAFAISALVGLLVIDAAADQHDICSLFRRNPDGTWTSIGPLIIEPTQSQRVKVLPGIEMSRRVKILPGMTFSKGDALIGTDIAAMLDKRCSGGEAPQTLPAEQPATR